MKVGDKVRVVRYCEGDIEPEIPIGSVGVIFASGDDVEDTEYDYQVDFGELGDDLFHECELELVEEG